MSELPWLWPLIGTLLSPSALAAILLSLVRSHDFRFDTRMRRQGRETQYSFVIANPLEQRIPERVTLVFELMLRRGAFLAPPTVLCGPKPVGYRAGFADEEIGLESSSSTWKLGSAGPRFIVTVPYFRPSSTWVVLCRTNGCDGDVALHLFLGKKKLSSVRGSVRPPRVPWAAPWLWAVITLLSETAFVVPRISFFTTTPWTVVDTISVGGIAAFSSAAFFLLWERRRRPVFAYEGWDTPAFKRH